MTQRFLRDDGQFAPLASTASSVVTTLVTKNTTAAVLLNNTALFFDGPSVAQGSSGTWYASGTVTVTDGGPAQFTAQLWDGTTPISIAEGFISAGGFVTSVSVSGVVTSPAGNLRISVKDPTSAGGSILSTAVTPAGGSNIIAIRIG